MTEKKFRAWCEHRKEYVKDFLICNDGLVYICRFNDIPLPTSVPQMMSATLEPWTGYIDSNKEYVYENDIVNKKGQNYIVVFSKKACKFCVRMDNTQWFGTFKKVYSLIGSIKVGNIHQDADLLEGKE